jgi:DNA invertase Pin-like site-specific DNA recombinase
VIAFGYVHVSTAEQAAGELGMDAQRHAIRTACARRAWTLRAVYEDAGVSSTANHRPGLQSALAACRSHPDAMLIVAKLEEGSRVGIRHGTSEVRSRWWTPLSKYGQCCPFRTPDQAIRGLGYIAHSNQH